MPKGRNEVSNQCEVRKEKQSKWRLRFNKFWTSHHPEVAPFAKHHMILVGNRLYINIWHRWSELDEMPFTPTTRIYTDLAENELAEAFQVILLGGLQT